VRQLAWVGPVVSEAPDEWKPSESEMRTALSNNELEILDRQVAAISSQLSEIAASLEARLGTTSELAMSARDAQREFAKFTQRVRRRVAEAETLRPDSESRSA
jgi:hypothetical protein